MPDSYENQMVITGDNYVISHIHVDDIEHILPVTIDKVDRTQPFKLTIYYLFFELLKLTEIGMPALSPLTCKIAFDVPRSSCAVHGITVRCLGYGQIRSTVELHFSPLARSSHVVTHGTTGIPIVHKPVNV